jgi:hypothetical protein
VAPVAGTWSEGPVGRDQGATTYSGFGPRPQFDRLTGRADGPFRPGLPVNGLVPFEVSAESQGFICNGSWAAIKRETLGVVAEGSSTPEDVERIFTLSPGAPFGPFRMMDAVGLDVVFDMDRHACPRPRCSLCVR